MCFTKRIESKEEAKPLIATEDILVWKSLSGGYSPYYLMKYDRGFHYYNTGKKPLGIYVNKYVSPHFGETIILSVNIGLHSYKSKDKCFYGRTVKMYIPKGAQYFENSYCYVSSELVWY